jgi:WD40 repeat protein
LEELHVSTHGNGGKLLIPPYGDQVLYYDGDTIEIYAIPSGEREAEKNFGNCCQEMMYSPGGTRIAHGGMLWNTVNSTFQTMAENEKVIRFSQNGNYVYSIREEWWWVERRTVDLELHHQVNLDLTPDPSLGGLDDYSTYNWVVGDYWRPFPDGTMLIGGWYGIPYLTWNTENGEVVSIEQGDIDYRSLAFSPNGQYLIDIIDAGYLQINERQTNGVYERLTWIEAWGDDIDFIGNKNLLITDEIIRVYSLPSLELVKMISLDDRVRVTAVSPDGRLVAASLGDKVVLVDFETGDVIHTLDVSSWGVYSLAFSSDGRYLATASCGGVIRLWGVPLSQGE